jgi:hypothetical protein
MKDKLNEILFNQAKLNEMFQLVQNQHSNNSNINNNMMNKLKIIENQSNHQFNLSKSNNEIIVSQQNKLDKLYVINENQSQLIVNQQNKIDKLFEIIEKQSQILTKLESKIMFDWQKYVLAYNIQMNELLNQGFKTVYNQLYSHVTTETILLNIKSQCNRDSIICVGGAYSNNNTLLLVSCGSCLDILTTTPLIQPRLVNGAWWYFTPGRSFGFAPNSNIFQGSADHIDCGNAPHTNCKDSNRLSWHLNDMGGYRLGI